MQFHDGVGLAALPKSRQPIRVAFFIGSDVTSHIVVNRLIPILLDSGISVLLYLTRSRPSPRRAAVLRQLHFVEHALLQDYAYPYVDLHGAPWSDGFNTPDGWLVVAPKQLSVSTVDDVNDPELVAAPADVDL